MSDITAMVTNKAVKDTVETMKSAQDSALSSIKDMAGQAGSLMSGMQSIMSNAKNVISQTISGITGTLAQSVSKFAQQATVGLTSTLTDLSQKFGSSISEITGKVDGGAIASKLSFVADTTSAAVNGVSLFGSGSEGVNGLLKNFSNGQLDKLVSASGLSSIANNSDLKSAISSVTDGLSNMTSAAKSLVGDVLSLPSKAISTVTSTISDVTGGLINSVTSSVGQLANVANIGSVDNLVKDMFDIYSLGRSTYDMVTGKDTNAIMGIASQFNNSFPEVQSLLNVASTICSAISGNMIDNYGKNKDLFDLSLFRMANNGMFGSINQLMNCGESQKYITDDTYTMLANRLTNRSNVGDVFTASALQSLVGNSRISNSNNLMYNLAYNLDDRNQDNINEYMNMLNRMNINPNNLTGRTYTSNNGNTVYVYTTNRLNPLGNSSPNLTDVLLGGNSKLRNLSYAIADMFS